MTSRGRLLAGILALAVLAVTAAWAFTRDGGDGVGSEPRAGNEGRSELAVLSVRGAPHALIAVVGVGESRPPAAVVVPSGVTVVAPGQGETTAEGVAALPGPSMRVAVSNALGTWVPHYGVLELEGLATAVDRAGGLRVDVPEPVTVTDAVIGPGSTLLDGADVSAYLRAEGDDASQRWAAAVDALLASPMLEEGDLVEADDRAEVLRLVRAAEGAVVQLAPAAPLAASGSVLDQPAADELVREVFGGREPTPIVVQNGNGRPNIGEAVAERLLPAGFRVVLSQNADTFRHRLTEIAATAAEFADEAERVQQLLGVGRVVVSQVPSGLADITIVVGRDFTA